MHYNEDRRYCPQYGSPLLLSLLVTSDSVWERPFNALLYMFTFVNNNNNNNVVGTVGRLHDQILIVRSLPPETRKSPDLSKTRHWTASSWPASDVTCGRTKTSIGQKVQTACTETVSCVTLLLNDYNIIVIQPVRNQRQIFRYSHL